ncbi:MAG: SH3 domain-containing protein, partial [Armatimonadetes bacterium]|nr:SH3 domain-containing protein [Armatimonadota bacterium]
RLRARPSRSSRVVATLSQGQTVYVVDRHGSWYRLRVHGGNAGWVHASLVKIVGSSPARPSSPAAQAGQPAGGRADFPSPRVTPIKLYEPPGNKTILIQAWAAGDDVNMRAGPGLGAAVKRKLSRGTRVVVSGLRDHWVYATLDDGTSGWIAGWLLDYTNPRQCHIKDESGETFPVRVGWVARPEVNVRLGPGLDYPEVGEAALGTPFIILQRQDQWYRAAFSNGMVAWVASWLVDTREQQLARRRRMAMIASGKLASASVSGVLETISGIGHSIVQLAMSYLGYPYVRGGESPTGFDCSGFVRFILRQFGIEAPHDTRRLYCQGRPVARDELRPGDIVFFRNTYREGISHVGIYIGDDKFIHASTHSTGVRISSLNKPFYASRYAGARRMH